MGKQKTCVDNKNIVRAANCLCKKPQPRIQWNPPFAKSTEYNGKVLLGNWFEDSCEYQKNKYHHNSEYLSEYVLKPNTRLPKSVIWDGVIRGQGSDVVEGNVIDKSKSRYMTSYYLSYELLPMLVKQSEEKSSVTVPKRNPYFEDYGNQENYGIEEYKISTWKYERNDPRSTAETVCEATYIHPTKESYKFHRWGRVKPTKGKYGDVYAPLPPYHPRLARCNPLTWECRKVVTPPV